MNKKRIILFGFLAGLVLLSVVNLNFVAAAPESTPVPVTGDSYQTQLQARERVTFRFRERTQLTINCSEDCQLNMYCNALQIGTKYFELDIETEEKLEINMTCNEEEAELGLINGHAYTARNRNRYQYQEGFCVSLECNGTFTQARLRIQVTAQNREGKWAYYNGSTEEWVTVPTTIKDGYLVASTDHFSTWTVLIPETTPDYTPYIVAGVIIVIGIVAAIGIVIYVKKR